MRVTSAHLEAMREAIAPLDTTERREAYRTGRFPRAELVRDVNKRYRWDLYYAAARVSGGMPDSTDGYGMAHIDTALRAIVAPLGGAS